MKSWYAKLRGPGYYVHDSETHANVAQVCGVTREDICLMAAAPELLDMLRTLTKLYHDDSSLGDSRSALKSRMNDAVHLLAKLKGTTRDNTRTDSP